VARLSGYADYIVRPLSAQLLPETLPEKEGKLDRSRLLDLQGRGRKRQMELVQSFGISEYSNPAGGCLLTDPIFSRRLRDLFTHQSEFQRRDFELLKSGRHVRINEHTKIIVGKNERDNTAILNFRREGDAILDAKDYPGPVVLIPAGAERADLETAAAICARYSDAPKGQEIIIECQADGKTIQIRAKSANPDEVAKLII